MGTHIDSDLMFGIDSGLGTVTRVGDLVIVRTEDAVGAWDAVTTSASTGEHAVASVAEELAAQGVTVEITGPQGLVARLGAGIDSGRGLVATGSRKVELGDRHASGALVRARMRRADPRLGAAAGGAVLAGGAVVLLARRRRRRRTVWEIRRDQATAVLTAAVAEASARGKDALPALRTGYEHLVDAAGPHVSSALEQARDVALPRAVSAAQRAREVAVPKAVAAYGQARDVAVPNAVAAYGQARDVAVPKAVAAAERARAAAAPRAQAAYEKSRARAGRPARKSPEELPRSS